VHSVTATVAGKREKILTDANGLPLYYHQGDSATRSPVPRGLASIWPPLTARRTPHTPGLSGTLTLVHDSLGKQVAYNGHLLYTFVNDRRGVVTGQSVANFFVATPNLAHLPSRSSS